MVRIRVSDDDAYDPYDTFSQRRQLEVCRAHRNGWPGERPYGFDDLPVRLTGEEVTYRGLGTEFHEFVSPYELQVMMTWGSTVAMRGWMMEPDVIEGLGQRVALALVKENP